MLRYFILQDKFVIVKSQIFGFMLEQGTENKDNGTQSCFLI